MIKRAKAIFNAAKKYYPAIPVTFPEVKNLEWLQALKP
jgi:hypothetical protein